MLQEVHSCLTATAKLTHLTSLSFENLQLSEESDSDLDEGLLEALVFLPLQQLHIDPCVLNSVTCTSLAAAFSHTNVTALRSVVIVASKAEMQPEECTALLQELGKLPGLQCLKLTRVKQDCDELMAICKDMKRLTGLTQLHLEHCFKVRRGRMHVTDILAGKPPCSSQRFPFSAWKFSLHHFQSLFTCFATKSASSSHSHCIHCTGYTYANVTIRQRNHSKAPCSPRKLCAELMHISQYMHVFVL